jgi:GT2 family glycosyltransferase
MTWGPDLVPQPGSLFRRSTIDRIGPLDESLRFAMDLDVLIRLRRAGRFVNTRRVQAKFRWHPESNTVADRSGSLDESEMVKRRYYTPLQSRLRVLWERPVRVATRLAARRLNARLSRLEVRGG